MLIEELSIASVHAAFADGSLTCRDLTERYLARIAACDQTGPVLNAVVTINPRALETADDLDSAWRADRAKCGPLHGIPILVKDNTDTADMPTTGSSKALKNHRPARDAFIVAKLRAAGALVLAKTTLTELAMGGTTAGSLHGQTLNPYDFTRTPGGSSGGTGAGIAANYAVFGTGSDTYQSIRSPASACSLVGLRGTRGLVSRTGLIPFAPTQDEAGPIARTAEDLARALDVMAGADPEDSVTADSTGGYTAFLDAGALRGKRIGVLRQFFGTAAPHIEVNARMAHNLDALKQAGAEAIDIEIPNLNALTDNIGLGDYEMREAFDRYLERAGPGAAARSFDDFVARGQYMLALHAQLMAMQSKSRLDPAYGEIVRRRDALRDALLFVMNSARLDAVVYPHQRRLVAKVGEEQLERNGVLANATGFPAISVPGGFSSPSPDAPLGVPVGIEFLGRPWSEGALIGIAHAFERATKLRHPPPLDYPSP